MEILHFELAAKPAHGTRKMALVGVVASGNLEVLLERDGAADRCTIEINTSAHGFSPLWEAVMVDFVSRRTAGGLRISINDGGARPDTGQPQRERSCELLGDVTLDQYSAAGHAELAGEDRGGVHDRRRWRPEPLPRHRRRRVRLRLR